MGSRPTSTLKRWCVSLVVLVAFFGLQARGFAQATDEPAQQPDPTLSLAPSKGRSGSTVKASGEGYCGSVLLRWDDEVQLNSGESDENGNISITFTVPRDAALGQHTVTSTSECGGTTVRFTVVKDHEIPGDGDGDGDGGDTGGDGDGRDDGDGSGVETPPADGRGDAPLPPASEASPQAPEASPQLPEASPQAPKALPPALEAPPQAPEASPQLPEALPPAPRAPPSAPAGAPDSYQNSTLAQYEEIVKRELESGVILYNPPERAQVGVVNRVEVRIAREEFGELAEGLRGKADPRVEHLLVGTTMSAKLEGRAFDIIPIGSNVQYLASTGFREWRWDVTPTAAGKHSLFLTVWALHERYPNPIREKVLERQVDVTVNPAYSLPKWLSNNWEKLVAALVGIIGIIEGYRRLRLRRADDQSGDTASDRGRKLKRILGRRKAKNRP